MRLGRRASRAALVVAAAAALLGAAPATTRTADVRAALVSEAFEPASWAARDSGYRSRIGRPPVATPRGFDLGAEYKDALMVEALLEGYHERYPEITALERLGTTHMGLPILALRISDHPHTTEDEPAVLLVGGVHGHELLAVDYALDAVQSLLERSHEPEVRRWIDALDLWLVPLANPDGNYVTLRLDQRARRGRKNGRDNDGDGRFDPAVDGVDLNRNFAVRWGAGSPGASSSERQDRDYRGLSAESEPETRALAALARRMHFVAALSWHTRGTMVLSPYTIDGLDNPSPDVAWQVAEDLCAATPTQPNGRRMRVRRSMYAVDGTEQDWYRNAFGTLAYIVEGSHHNPTKLRTRRASIAGVRPILGRLLDRLLDGPSVYGRVTDQEGRPLAAEVRIAEVQTREGEIWTSRALDGRYERLLPGPGTYTVRVVVGGDVVATRTTQVVKGRVQVDVDLGSGPK